MKYFAYGSNMCEGRLRDIKRAPSARVLGVAVLAGHSLRFHKRSRDGSGKADAFRTGDPSDTVWGVVFEIDDAEKPALDRAEGLGNGYSERVVDVVRGDETISATMYHADVGAIDSSLTPYSWYLRFVEDGARQQGLPSPYIETIASTPCTTDPDEEQEASNRAIRCSDLNLDSFEWLAQPKAWRIAPAAEATNHWLNHTKGPLDQHFHEERWYWARINISNLRTAQGEFGSGWQLQKHALLKDLLEANHTAIEDGSFPKAESIKRGFEPPAIIVLLDRAGEVHVTDGLGRSFMALWHVKESIDAYVFDEWSDRPLPAT